MPRVYGIVYDRDTGKGIPYVSVIINGRTTVTDLNGYYSIEVPQGKHTLLVRTAMYSPYTKEIVVSTDLRIDIPLAKAIL
jgi:hypothetical protein